MSRAAFEPTIAMTKQSSQGEVTSVFRPNSAILPVLAITVAVIVGACTSSQAATTDINHTNAGAVSAPSQPGAAPSLIPTASPTASPSQAVTPTAPPPPPTEVIVAKPATETTSLIALPKLSKKIAGA